MMEVLPLSELVTILSAPSGFWVRQGIARETPAATRQFLLRKIEGNKLKATPLAQGQGFTKEALIEAFGPCGATLFWIGELRLLVRRNRLEWQKFCSSEDLATAVERIVGSAIEALVEEPPWTVPSLEAIEQQINDALKLDSSRE